MKYTHLPVVHLWVSGFLMMGLIAGIYLEHGPSRTLIGITLGCLVMYVLIIGFSFTSSVVFSETGISFPSHKNSSTDGKDFQHVYAFFLTDYQTSAFLSKEMRDYRIKNPPAPSILVFRKQKPMLPIFILLLIDVFFPFISSTKKVLAFQYWKDPQGTFVPSIVIFRKIYQHLPERLQKQITLPPIEYR